MKRISSFCHFLDEIKLLKKKSSTSSEYIINVHFVHSSDFFQNEAPNNSKEIQTKHASSGLSLMGRQLSFFCMEIETWHRFEREIGLPIWKLCYLRMLLVWSAFSADIFALDALGLLRMQVQKWNLKYQIGRRKARDLILDLRSSWTKLSNC